MVREILDHLAKIAAEEGSSKEDSPIDQETSEQALWDIERREFQFHLFRTSEAAEFLKEINIQSFDIFLSQLEDIIYNVQRLAPYVDHQHRLSVLALRQGLETEENKNRYPDYFRDTNRLSYLLRDLTQLVKQGDQWYRYELKLASPYEMDRDLFLEQLRTLGIHDNWAKYGLLTQAQLQELSNNSSYVAVSSVEVVEIKRRYEDLLHVMSKVEGSAKDLAKEAGIKYIEKSDANLVDSQDNLN